jgi:hypothetical protein
LAGVDQIKDRTHAYAKIYSAQDLQEPSCDQQILNQFPQGVVHFCLIWCNKELAQT